MGQLIQSIRTPWLAIGDYNAEPQELAKLGWPKLVDGTIRTAVGPDYTCTLGKERMIDFMVHSPSIIRFIDSVVVDDAACHEGGRAHFGLQLKLKLKLEQAFRWALP
eukprot:5531536-Pyramimonas_sp.AAC.1